MSECEQDEDFATLFAASAKTKRFETGQHVTGVIVAIGDEVTLVDVGAKGEASLATAELKNEDGAVTFTRGDRVEATVVSTQGGITVSRKLQRRAATQQQIADAFRAGLPVDGRVEKQVKGGYEVTIAQLRAFCPYSQIDTVKHTDPAVHEGRVYAFRIIEFAEGGHKFVVSRRALLDAEQQVKAAAVRAALTPGAVVTGRVASVREFGAFVDLGGGVQGLLHVSEMGWSRVTDPSQVVTPGQELTVKVLRIESRDGADKIGLGLKQLSDDPWASAASRYGIGQVVMATVTRVTDFGAFVELEPGVEGLAHASTFAPTGRPGGWAKTIVAGQPATVEILSVDGEKKRIGVALVEEGSAKAGRAASAKSAVVPGAKLTGTVDRHEKFGVFVFLAPGLTGLVPLSETGIPREGDVAGAFPVGAKVEVIVLEVDPAGRRIRLSLTAVKAAEEAADVRDYAARVDADTRSSGFGSLADTLRGALSKKG